MSFYKPMHQKQTSKNKNRKKKKSKRKIFLLLNISDNYDKNKTIKR